MEYDSRTPIYLQVVDMLKRRMVRGEIRPGDKLPSTRALALEYGVNPNTAARIYDEMEALGLCHTERGLGTFMTDDASVVQKLRRQMAKQLTRDFVREMAALGYTAEQMKQAIGEEL